MEDNIKSFESLNQGDKVRCINKNYEGQLTYGKIYNIISKECLYSYLGNMYSINVMDDKNIKFSYSIDLFEKIEEEL